MLKRSVLAWTGVAALALALVVALAALLAGPRRASLPLPAALVDALGGPAPGGVVSPSAARKCLAGGRVAYTDGPCPEGTREQALDGGTLTVIAAPPAAAAASSARLPHARDLLLGPPGPDLRERRMDQVIGR